VYATTDADPKLTSLDVYEAVRPEGCGAAPILFWVHGGGWQQGDKANQLSDKKRLAAEQGWTLVSLNYRLTPAVQYPVPNQDVADGIGWFLAHAAQFNADPSRTAVMCHSAGGGIVAAVSTDERYLANAGRSLDDLDCLVSLDTEGYDVTKKGDDGGIYDAMFGTDPAAWPDQSPVNHVRAGAGIPDAFIVTRGSAARLANAHAFADALTTAGVPTTIIEAQSLDHNGVNDAVGAPETPSPEAGAVPRCLPGDPT
jgi:acetyl esterase/lipase